MKKAITLLALCLLIFTSCSKDADPEPIKKSPAEYLVEKSPWIFSNADVLEVTYDGGEGLSISEIKRQIVEANRGRKIVFNADGSGTFYLSADYNFPLSWRFAKSSPTTYDYSKLYLIEDSDDFLSNVRVTENEFSFEMEDCIGLYEDACAIVRFTYK